MKLERKSDHIKVLESESLSSVSAIRSLGLQCINCKERYHLVKREGDNNSVFCTNCGALTPLRTAKHDRGLAEPFMQQQTTGIVQPKKEDTKVLSGKDRRPQSINRNKKDPLEESLISKGFQVLDVQTIEPSP